MSAIVDLLAWRMERARPEADEGAPAEQVPGVVLPYRPAAPRSEPPPGEDDEFARLTRAVDRLQKVVSTALRSSGGVDAHVETELLAILGELTMDCVADATSRAERLADGLAQGNGAKV